MKKETTKKVRETAPAETAVEKTVHAAEAAIEKTVQTAAKTKTVAAKTVKSATKTAEKAVKAAEEVVKKAPVKKAAVKELVYLQYLGREISKDELIDRVKAIWTGELGRKASDIKSITLYLKPEENSAYYVINGEETGRIDL